MASRLAELGLERPRDARDAVAPLWELPIEAQLATKHAEMAALSTNKLLAADVGRLISSSSAAACEPIRSVTQERWGAKPAPMRNTCEFHIGRGRDGKPCCGFRLGLASSLDGTTVAPPTDVPFVPGWMAAVAAIVSEEMAIWAAAAQQEEEVLVVQAEAAAPHNNNDDGRGHDNYYYQQLRLRGSERRSKGVAVLTRGSDRDGDAHGGYSIDRLMDRLMERMKAAASEAGMNDLTIVERDTDGTLRPPTAGAIEEELQSGLALSISPLCAGASPGQSMRLLCGHQLDGARAYTSRRSEAHRDRRRRHDRPIG